jgi:DNA-binding CsgD family transcriptional regulator
LHQNTKRFAGVDMSHGGDAVRIEGTYSKGLRRRVARLRVPFALVALAICQCACTLVFSVDIILEIWSAQGEIFHLGLELTATLGLFIGAFFGVHWVTRVLRKQEDMTRSLTAASGVLSDLMSSYFRQWSLTSAEVDVATFTIKGFSIAETAAMRKSTEGTVKSHLNAIYRKAGVQGRAQLVSVLVEDLLNTPLLGADNTAS